jgi:hypothetical protein
MDLSIS